MGESRPLWRSLRMVEKCFADAELTRSANCSSSRVVDAKRLTARRRETVRLRRRSPNWGAGELRTRTMRRQRPDAAVGQAEGGAVGGERTEEEHPKTEARTARAEADTASAALLIAAEFDRRNASEFAIRFVKAIDVAPKVVHRVPTSEARMFISLSWWRERAAARRRCPRGIPR